MRRQRKLVTKKLADHEWTVLIWRDADGYLIAEVPELQGCYTQARSWDELMSRIEEAILLCLEDAEEEVVTSREFVGIQRLRLVDVR
ncbi:MAG: type II toxin-antitoxin system HicB family antitoxin [Armatimonadota bacterium]